MPRCSDPGCTEENCVPPAPAVSISVSRDYRDYHEFTFSVGLRIDQPTGAVASAVPPAVPPASAAQSERPTADRFLPLSANLRNRFNPPLRCLNINGYSTLLTPYVYMWILTHVWDITEADRAAIVNNITFYYAPHGSAVWTDAELWAEAERRGFTDPLRCHRSIWLHEYAPSGQIDFYSGFYAFERRCSACQELFSACACNECIRCYRRSTYGNCEACDVCELCCNCVVCDGCSEVTRREHACGDCNCCQECCECVRCDSCDRVVDSVDDNGCCDNCADDRDDSGSTEIGGDGSYWDADSPKARKAFNCRRMAGAEVEYNRCDDFAPISRWARNWESSVHSDGSCGWECVTSPAAGDHMVRQAKELVQAMKRADCTVNEQCGLHVHVDARDLQWADIERLVKVYAKVEPVLFLMGGQSRVKSEWCAPVGKRFATALQTGKDASERKKSLLTAVFTSGRHGESEFNGLRSKMQHGVHKKDGARYVAMNLMPWLAGRTREEEYQRDPAGRIVRDRYGNSVMRKSKKVTRRPDCTVEFRLHRNLETLDADRLVGWMKLLCRVVDYASKATDAEVAALPANAMRALQVIAPDCFPWCVERLKSWRRVLKRKARLIRYSPETHSYGLTVGGN